MKDGCGTKKKNPKPVQISPHEGLSQAATHIVFLFDATFCRGYDMRNYLPLKSFLSKPVPFPHATQMNNVIGRILPGNVHLLSQKHNFPQKQRLKICISVCLSEINLTFPLLIMKNVSPLAPCLIMYSPSL